MAVLWAARSSRTNCSSSPTIRPSVLITPVPRTKIRSLRPLRGTAIFRLSAFSSVIQSLRILHGTVHCLLGACHDAAAFPGQPDTDGHDQSGSECTFRLLALPHADQHQPAKQRGLYQRFQIGCRSGRSEGRLQTHAKGQHFLSVYPANIRTTPRATRSYCSRIPTRRRQSITPSATGVDTIGNNMVNDVRIGWSHVTVNTGNSWGSGVGQFGNTLGIGNGNPGNLPGLLALNFNNSVVTNIGTQESTQLFDDHVWQFEDAVSWTHGRHNFKFGGQLWRQNIKTFYAGNNGELGLMDFDGRFTAPAVGASGGDGGADFFLGLNYQYGRGVSTGGTWQQTSNVIGIYAQDTWRVTDRLTLNLGLRYDAHSPWVEQHDHQANYNFTTGNIDLAGKNGASRALYSGTWGGKDFQPRIGFAWTPAALGDKTVIRGAFTISSYLEGTGTNLRLTLNPPFTTARNQSDLQRHSASSNQYVGRNCRYRPARLLRCTYI